VRICVHNTVHILGFVKGDYDWLVGSSVVFQPISQDPDEYNRIADETLR
jgi:hypothetical protein